MQMRGLNTTDVKNFMDVFREPFEVTGRAAVMETGERLQKVIQ